jgi:hypothetical protein
MSRPNQTQGLTRADRDPILDPELVLDAMKLHADMQRFQAGYDVLTVSEDHVTTYTFFCPCGDRPTVTDEKSIPEDVTCPTCKRRYKLPDMARV